MRITTHEREEVSAGPFCGLVVVDLRRLLDKLLPGINVLWRQEYKVLTYHTEIKHNFYAFTPIKEYNMNFLQFFHGQNGSIQCMQSFINIGQGVL